MNDKSNDKPYYVANEEKNKKQRRYNKLLFYGFYAFVGVVFVIAIYLLRVDRYEFYLNNKEILLETGSTYQIKLTPKNAMYYDITNYEYRSEDPSVVVVSEGGTITSIGKGETNIVIKFKNSFHEKRLKVTSVDIEVSDIKVETVEKIEVDESSKVTTIINGQDNIGANVKYNSDNESVLKVDEYGNLNAINRGTATITATTDNGVYGKAEVKVTNLDDLLDSYGYSDAVKMDTTPVEPELNNDKPIEENNGSEDEQVTEIAFDDEKEILMTSIKLNITNTILNVGDSVKLSASPEPTNATNLDITWTSSNASVAKVETGGRVTALKAGTTTIKVTSSNGKTAICDILVKAKETLAPSTPATTTPTTPSTPVTPAPGPTADRIHYINVLNYDRLGPKAYETLDAGEAILLESNGKYGLIDTGYGEPVVAQYLLSQGVTHLEFIIFTHSHIDHTGGLQGLIPAGIRIDRIYIKNYDVANVGKSDYSKVMWNYIKNTGIPRTNIDDMSDGTVWLGDMKVFISKRSNKIASGKNAYYENGKLSDNKNSAIVYITVNGHKVLVTGDYVDLGALQTVIDNHKPLDIYTVGHHGYQGGNITIYAQYIVVPNSRYQVEQGGNNGTNAVRAKQLSLFKSYNWKRTNWASAKTFGSVYVSQNNNHLFFSNDNTVVFNLTGSDVTIG